MRPAFWLLLLPFTLFGISLSVLAPVSSNAEGLFQTPALALPSLEQMQAYDARQQQQSLSAWLIENQQDQNTPAPQLVLINFWATWCAPCIQEMPQLIASAQAQEGVQLIAISEDLKSPQQVEAFIAKQGWRDPSKNAHDKALKVMFLYDQKMALLKQIQQQGIPVTLLYDAAGQPIGQSRGVIKEHEFDQLGQELLERLSKQ